MQLTNPGQRLSGRDLPYQMRVSAASDYGEWLSGFAWESWGTFTFKWKCPTVDSALRAFAYGWRQYQKAQGDGFAFVGVEEGRLYGRVHLHALLGIQNKRVITPGVSSAVWLGEWWKQKYGRSQILRYDPNKGASFYVAKYIGKEVTSEWQFLGNPVVRAK